MRCGLLGRTLSHSWSPAIHSLLGTYSYELFEKEPSEVEAFLRSGSWDGLNVTMPYKKTAAGLCRERSALAEALGSVNTLVRRSDGTIYGDNTDATGFLAMARSLPVDYSGKKALVLGSGGASVTVQAVLKELGCRVVVISRRGECTYDRLDDHADGEILVNATPVGMYPNNGERPVDIARLPRLEAVLDLVYHPLRTGLIYDAMARNIPCVSGLTMLVEQAAAAASLWTGVPVERAGVQAAIEAKMKNIVLIGMPGCGKTTAGRALAEELGRTFVDADMVFKEEFGEIPEFLAAHGEKAFRDAEHRILEKLGKDTGLVIATGGGCVTRQENREVLGQNGVIVWLQRPLEQLSVEARPLSQRDGVLKLYEQRKELYSHFCDKIADNAGTISETVNHLRTLL